MTCELLDIIILFSNDSLQLVGLRLERKERKIKKEKFQKKLKNVLVKCSRMGDILTPETSFSITSLKKKLSNPTSSHVQTLAKTMFESTLY